MRATLPLAIALSLTLALRAQDVRVRVDPHGPGSTASTTDYTTVQQALDHAPEPPAPYRLWIEIVPGIYHERINVTQNRPRVTLLGLGKDPSDVVITAAQFAKEAGGTFFTETAEINGDTFEADNLTFENTAGPVGQAVAAAVRSDRAVFKHCRFLGDQDTLFADWGRQYYVDSYIAGGVDFIFGNATAVFDHSEIHILRPGFLTAQSRTSPTQTTGYVIDHSHVTSSIETPPPADPTKVVRTSFFLGRPWRLYSRVVVMNTELPIDVDPAGWSVWNKSDPVPPQAFYATYNNSGPGWHPSELAPWSHQLTAAEAAAFEPQRFLRGTGDQPHWDPLAAAAKLPDPPVQLTAAEDHQRLLGLLHIDSLRPGVASSGKGPDPVNYDEAKANPWPNLPDPLRLTDGRKITTAAQWTKQRRPQLLSLFSHDIFGVVPPHVPAVHWRVASIDHETVGDTPVLVKHLIGHVDNSAYPLIDVNIAADLILPASATAPVPVVLELSGANPAVSGASPSHPATPPKPPAAQFLPTIKQQVIAKGWGFALLYHNTVQADNGAGLTQGIIGLVNHGQPRTLDDWGVLRAWAWGASRLLDYLETDPSVNARRVAIDGHSRRGKAALVTMAYDPRFAVAYISSSGAGGANLARRRYGEQLENIAAPSEYHWMGARYLRYAEASPQNITPADMPVDTNELIALCAPRPVFIDGGTLVGGDAWADTRGTFLAEVAAGPVYSLLGARPLLGPDGQPTSTFPPVGTALLAGDLAFRQHPGGHNPQPSFATFVDFASRFLTERSQPPSVATSTPAPNPYPCSHAPDPRRH